MDTNVSNAMDNTAASAPARRLRYICAVLAPTPATTPAPATATVSATTALYSLSTRDVRELELDASEAGLAAKAAALFHRHGCAVIRGLNDKWVPFILEAVQRTVAQSRRLEAQGSVERVDEGWVTPDGTLFIPAAWDNTPTEDNRHKPVMDLVSELGDAPNVERQIMVPAVDYQNSAALFQCACDERVLDIVEEIFGSPNIELFGQGQLVYKEPSGGHTVSLHQDAAFFEFGGSGLSPVGTLNYTVDTDNSIDNGPLIVFPGTHSSGFIDHVNTSSHLGLDSRVWGVQDGVSIEGKAGDSIFFHQHTVHGSAANHSKFPRATFINRYTKPEDDVIMPLATSVEMRAKALEAAENEKPPRERGIMVRGNRIFADAEWNLGAKSKGQFH